MLAIKPTTLPREVNSGIGLSLFTTHFSLADFGMASGIMRDSVIHIHQSIFLIDSKRLGTTGHFGRGGRIDLNNTVEIGRAHV